MRNWKEAMNHFAILFEDRMVYNDGNAIYTKDFTGPDIANNPDAYQILWGFGNRETAPNWILEEILDKPFLSNASKDWVRGIGKKRNVPPQLLLHIE